MHRRPPGGGARPGVVASVLATTASVYPAFLTGAVGVQLRDELEFSERELGLAIGAFFLAAALGSAPGGRAAQRLGATRALSGALVVTTGAMLAVASLVDSPLALAVGLAVAGAANAVTQPAANLYLSRTVRTARLGLAVSLKQAGMPSATLLGGLAVPLIALTVGWRWAYASGALLAVLAIGALTFVSTVGPGPDASGPRRRPRTPLGSLVVAALGMVFGAAAAGAIGAWIVSSAEASGVGSGAAGLVLTFGSAVGIVSRLVMGWRADRTGRAPLRTVSWMLALGSLGIVGLAAENGWILVGATGIAFGAGWAWPGLFNFAIVRANAESAAAATGVTQVGTYVGAVLGPVVFGLVVDASSYRTAWLVTAAWALIAAVIMRLASDRITAPVG